MAIDLPYHPQSCRVSCGPAALSMLLAYHNIDMTEQELMARAGTSPHTGTDNEAMVRVAHELGLHVEVHEPMTMDNLDRFVSGGEPVLVNYRNLENGNGHFALVIEVSDKSILLCDPEYGYQFRISRDVFLDRWLSHGGEHVQWGMVATGRVETVHTS